MNFFIHSIKLFQLTSYCIVFNVQSSNIFNFQAKNYKLIFCFQSLVCTMYIVHISNVNIPKAWFKFFFFNLIYIRDDIYFSNIIKFKQICKCTWLSIFHQKHKLIYSYFVFFYWYLLKIIFRFSENYVYIMQINNRYSISIW